MLNRTYCMNWSPWIGLSFDTNITFFVHIHNENYIKTFVHISRLFYWGVVASRLSVVASRRVNVGCGWEMLNRTYCMDWSTWIVLSFDTDINVFIHLDNENHIKTFDLFSRLFYWGCVASRLKKFRKVEKDVIFVRKVVFVVAINYECV